MASGDSQTRGRPGSYARLQAADYMAAYPDVRRFAWWLRHHRLYWLFGYRWLCWRYRKQRIGIPSPYKPPAEALALGRELAEKYGWRR